MAKTDNLSDFLTDVANAIRTKKGTTTLINPQDFSDEILSIVSSVGGDMRTLIDGSIETLTESDLSEITTIRSFAFYGCENLTTVTIPSNIMTIGNNAFEGCSNLQTLTISDGVQTIGASAFKGINASVINIPSTPLVLENEVFANNTALTSITIPSNITNIKDNAFGGCTNLTEITMDSVIPPSVSDTAFPSSVTAIYVKYGAYDDYKSQWTAYADKIVRLPAIPSTITVTVNNYLGELVQGATVTIAGNGQTYTGTTNESGVFVQGDLQPATYTISVADLDGFKTPESQQVEVVEDSENGVTITYLEKPAVAQFAEATPEQISAVSAEISANNMTSAQVYETYGWKIGDTTSFVLDALNEKVTIRIIGFNHDDLANGNGKAGITLEMTHCLKAQGNHSDSGTNAGGWELSRIRTAYLPGRRDSIPQEWRSVIKLVNKKSANGGSTNYTSIVTTTDDLFLLSYVEIFGKDKATTQAQNGAEEGDQYEYYIGKSATDRIKKRDANNTGDPQTANDWWLRSCSSAYTTHMKLMLSTGGASNEHVNRQKGVSFAFCV